MKKSPIESMSLDMKYVLSTKLSGNELIKLCATSNEMRKICTLKRFNFLWQDKIKEDFNIIYKDSDSYNEYMRLTISYAKTYWNLLAIDEGEPRNSWSKLYDTKEKAISSFYNEYVEIEDMDDDKEYVLNYSTFRKLFDDEDDLIDWNVYKISILPIKFTKQPEYKYIKQVDIDKMIDDFTKQINLSEDDSEDFKGQMEEIIYNLNAYIDDAKTEIDTFSEGICGYFGIDCKLFETFIYNLLLDKDEYFII